MAVLPFLRGALSALWRERRYSREKLTQFRTDRLNQIVRHARDNTKLWGERLAHIDPDGPINLAQVEPITKEELMDRFEDSIVGGDLSMDELETYIRTPHAGAQPYRGYMVATTSGTTGRIGYFVSDLRSFAELNGALLARILRHRLCPSEIARFSFGRRYRMAMAIANDGPFITRLVAEFKPALTGALVKTRTFSIMESVEATVHGLNRYRPHYLHGYPTFLEVLAHERLEGRLAIDPEFISLGSEPVASTARHALAKAFPRAQLSETYGATEAVAIANQCTAGRLHVNEDLVILEPVDASGRPVPVGVASDRVYVTNLVNRGQPLLRYEISDSVTLLGDDCPCGSPMLSVRVEGRSDDTIYLMDEHRRFQPHPPVPFEVLFLGVAGLKQYQLVHESQNRLRLLFVADDSVAEAAVRRELDRRFSRYFQRTGVLGCVHLELERVQEIPREATGHKLRQIFSRVPGPTA